MQPGRAECAALLKNWMPLLCLRLYIYIYTEYPHYNGNTSTHVTCCHTHAVRARLAAGLGGFCMQPALAPRARSGGDLHCRSGGLLGYGT